MLRCREMARFLERVSLILISYVSAQNRDPALQSQSKTVNKKVNFHEEFTKPAYRNDNEYGVEYRVDRGH